MTHLYLDLPALQRQFVGFDQLFLDINKTFNTAKQDNYPPYNIIRTGDNFFLIELAVAGFRENELDVETSVNSHGQNVLSVRGEQQREEKEPQQFLYKGLATRNFVRMFPLNENIEIVGATVSNGILSINLEQKIPLAQKTKKVAITFAA